MKRFTRRRPCPICRGFDSQQRGKEQRCHGFLSDDGRYAHCSREEYAGGLPINANSGTFAHRLIGHCDCGVRHDGGNNASQVPETAACKTAATYDYRDGSGKLRYQVVRLEPKSFYQRRPDGAGGWINNLNGVERVLYRLPELLAAETVWIPEGEADVENLVRRGLVATTNSGGAGKWLHEYSDSLRNRDVAILPDNDEPGRKHAEMVAKSLVGVAGSVRIVNLPNLPDKGESLPIRDEPEDEVSFQYKMSLGRVAC